MNQLIKSVTILFTTLLFATAAVAAPVTIKFATVAPEGSSWMNIMKEAAADLKKTTDGRVIFKLYAGGVAGDEPDVIKKIRIGQYQGGGFTGVGLGEILPESRIVELPFLFRNLQEFDHVQKKLTPHFEEHFRAKGYEFIAWAEPGLVYLMSQKPIRSAADLRGVKMWVWEGDPLAEALLKAFKVSPVPIALPDVLMSLQTGMINTVYAPPLAALAVQWNTRIKYLLDDPITNSTGAILVSKAAWEKIAPADQKTAKEVLRRHFARLTAVTRKQNQEAIAKFRQMGITVIKADPKNHEEMAGLAVGIRTSLIGRLYPAELLKEVEGYLAELRKPLHR